MDQMSAASLIPKASWYSDLNLFSLCLSGNSSSFCGCFCLILGKFYEENEEEDLCHAMYLLKMFTANFSALSEIPSLRAVTCNSSLFSYTHPGLPWCPEQFISSP